MEAINSVRDQTYDDWEVVVVDDGSTDGTEEMLAREARHDPRIRCFRHSRRQGAQAARNTGIRGSRGQWIAFLDADDTYLPDSLKLRLGTAQAAGAGAVHSECLVRLTDGATRLFQTPPMEGDIRDAVLRRPGPTFPGMLVRREHLDRIIGLDESVPAYQEWDTAIRLSAVTRFAYVHGPTFIYHVRDDSMSMDPQRNAAGYEFVVRKHAARILRRLGPEAMAAHLLEAARQCDLAGNRARATMLVLLAGLTWPFAPIAVARAASSVVRGGPVGKSAADRAK